MVVKNGEILFSRGYGMANLEERLPCSLHTNFRLASVTKQFTAMAILILAERESLSLAEPLTEFFPEFPAYGRSIKLRHLLNHTSGLLDYEELIPPGTILPVLDQDVLRLLMKARRTKFSPGSSYSYSNTAYALLALIVQVRSGQTFPNFLRQNIFQPLKMTATVAYQQGLSSVPNRAYGYSRRGRRFRRTDQSLTSSVLGDGGVYSSTRDLQRWEQALHSEILVSSPTLERAFARSVATDLPDTGYGFGWYIGRYRGLKEVWHSGDTIGFRTHITRIPGKKLMVVLLANRSEAQLKPLAYKLLDLFF
jgi:CubicO group peptidase (beta-lactamase class C family)